MYEVYYQTPETFRNVGGMMIDEITLDKLAETHRKVRTIDVKTPDEAFYEMQGEVWSPNGEARELILSLGLRHTSMSSGDVLHDLETGDYMICAPIGWKKLS